VTGLLGQGSHLKIPHPKPNTPNDKPGVPLEGAQADNRAPLRSSRDICPGGAQADNRARCAVGWWGSPAAPQPGTSKQAYLSRVYRQTTALLFDNGSIISLSPTCDRSTRIRQSPSCGRSTGTRQSLENPTPQTTKQAYLSRVYRQTTALLFDNGSIVNYWREDLG